MKADLILILQILFISSVQSSSIKFSNESTVCNGNCLKKCCPEGYSVMFRRKKCIAYNETELTITMPVYNDDIELTAKKMEDLFMLEAGAFANTTFKRRLYETTITGFKAYLTESGLLYLELPNAFLRWTPVPVGNYCLDFMLPPPNTTLSPMLRVWAKFSSENLIQGNSFFTISMIISCVFLVLVLVVYSLLPELRNIGGLVLMAYTFSLLCAFMFLMFVQQGNHTTDACVGLTVSVYFSFLASFGWMNVMSYDIWWTFRGYAKARPIHRRGEKFKFMMYGLYAWGMPLIMSVCLMVLNYSDLKHLPWFITPKIPDKGCFLEGGEKLLYLYVPMLIMICLNWLFYLMTAFNIWRLSRGTAVLDSAAAGNPAAHRTQRHRFLVYLKLSILMGLNWILEVVSSFMPQLNIWYISDAYNLLIGLSIFLIFVCKKKIFNKLLKRFRGYKKSKWSLSLRSRSRSSSTTDSSNLSQEAPQVCINPQGPA